MSMLYEIDFFRRRKPTKEKRLNARNSCRGARLVGIVRFERTHEGVKDPCLTTWLYPSVTHPAPYSGIRLSAALNEKGTGKSYAF